MSEHCEDCGCTLQNGICSNCQEELFIETFQAEDIEKPLSQEFQEKAAEQSKYVESK
jgi:hypothetical protein